MNQSFGVEIIYKNGKRDWVDPVSDEPIEKDGVLIVTNDYYSYEYTLSSMDRWFKYDLCNVCRYDVRTFDCTEDECLNPMHT